MTGTEIVHEVQELYQEKGLECRPETVQLLQEVSWYLRRQGIPLSREILDFAIDVIRVKEIVGLPAEATAEEVDGFREEMVEWLEALGWRRDWFTRPLR